MMARKALKCVSLLVIILQAVCQSQAVLTTTVTVTALPRVTITPTEVPPTLTVTPSLVPSPSPTMFPLPTSDATIVTCDERHPADDDLLAIVTASFGLAPDYVPGDLVRVGGYVSGYVTLPDLMLRRNAAEALGKMVSAMKVDGLVPIVLSTYRSYTDQYVTYRRWLAEDPQNTTQVSALPGHSEHQLGTVVDFSSPGLLALTGDPAVKFSPLFAQTGEGLWLTTHAYEYGFTLTNPLEALPWTGLTYEPWHYRWVGVDLASYLVKSGYFLVEYLFRVRVALPCIPALVAP